jgi:hypothetical protein
MYAQNTDLWRQHACDRQQALIQEANTNRLLRLYRFPQPRRYERIRKYVGAKLVQWGTRLQEQSGSITPETYSV